MKTIVIVAYYHLLHAIETALTLEEKPALVVCTEYTKMEDSLVESIENSGVFSTVIKTNTQEFLEAFSKELKKTKKMDMAQIRKIGTSLFDEYIDSYYYPKFEGLDFDDDVYIYTDYHLILYSINKHFKNIIMCEDGYQILYKRYETYKLYGYFSNLERFIEIGAYPKMRFECDKISKIICSGDDEGLPDELRKKVVIWDFKEETKKNQEQYSETIKGIFPIRELEFSDGALLLIEQPLYRTHYCSNLSYYLYYRKLVKELSREHKIIIKPHPAGKRSVEAFENENVTILPKWIPAECLNYLDTEFDDVITFNSSSLDLISNTKHHTSLCDPQNINTDYLKEHIREYIEGEMINVGIFVFCDDFSKEISKELGGFFGKRKRFSFHLNIIVEENCKNKAAILDGVEKLKRKHNKEIKVIPVEQYDQDQVMRILLDNYENYDHCIAINGENKNVYLENSLKSFYRGLMAHCTGLHHLCTDNVVICNPLVDHVLTGTVNVIWSNYILKVLKEAGVSTALEAIEYVYEHEVSTGTINLEMISPAENCLDTIRRFAEETRFGKLAEIYRYYSLVIDILYESRKGRMDVFDNHAKYINDPSIEDKDLFSRLLLAALMDERRLRVRTYNRVTKLDSSGSVMLALKMVSIRKKIKKKIKRVIKKIKKIFTREGKG